MRKKQTSDAQLSLFDNNDHILEAPMIAAPTTVLEFVRARFERGPDMTQEEYKRWIKILINNSLKSMD